MKKTGALFLLAVLCLAQSGIKSGIDRSMLDTSCKPCDDFWRYATGSFLDRNPIPATFSRWGEFTMLRDASQERLKVILEAASTRPSSAAERVVGDFYASCMNTPAIDAAGSKPLQPELRRIAAIRSRQDLVGTLVALEPRGGLGPESVTTQQDRQDAGRMIAAVAPAGLSLPDRDYYFKDDQRSREIRDEFVQHVQRMFVLLGDDSGAAGSEAKAVLDFETTLAGARLTNVERRDPYRTFHKMDLAQLQQLAPAYDWKAVFKLLRVPEQGQINVSEPDYIQTVERQLREAPLETWKTWLRWRVADVHSQDLSKPFFDEWFRFDQGVLSGVKEQRPRWKVCASEVDARLSDPLGRLYIEKYFPPEAKRRMTELVENLRAALRVELENAAWLEPETRRNAVRKLDNFDPQIGYPPKWRDYAQIRVNRADYAAGVESVALENRRFTLAKAGHKSDRDEWGMTAPTVNAQYSSTKNSITFPAGILQPPFFIFDADDAVNYGAIGAVIGHEMGHGFDDQGSKSDADGNLKNWWTDQDRQKFDARAACVTNQFDSIDLGGGLRHNGKLVTGEAMGDLGGIRLAYEAYHRSLNGKEAPVLDGFTGDQRFFLAFARVWADQSRPEQVRLQLSTDPHPLSKYRANATLENMPEFHRAFGCKLGDAMVRPPEQQCRLW